MTVLWHKPLCSPSTVSTLPTPCCDSDLDSLWNASFSDIRNESAPAWIMASHVGNNSFVWIVLHLFITWPHAHPLIRVFWLTYRPFTLISVSVLGCRNCFSWRWLMINLIPDKSVDSSFNLFLWMLSFHSRHSDIFACLITCSSSFICSGFMSLPAARSPPGLANTPLSALELKPHEQGGSKHTRLSLNMHFHLIFTFFARAFGHHYDALLS